MTFKITVERQSECHPMEARYKYHVDGGTSTEFKYKTPAEAFGAAAEGIIASDPNTKAKAVRTGIIKQVSDLEFLENVAFKNQEGNDVQDCDLGGLDGLNLSGAMSVDKTQVESKSDRAMRVQGESLLKNVITAVRFTLLMASVVMIPVDFTNDSLGDFRWVVRVGAILLALPKSLFGKWRTSKKSKRSMNAGIQIGRHNLTQQVNKGDAIAQDGIVNMLAKEFHFHGMPLQPNTANSLESDTKGNNLLEYRELLRATSSFMQAYKQEHPSQEDRTVDERMHAFLQGLIETLPKKKRQKLQRVWNMFQSAKITNLEKGCIPENFERYVVAHERFLQYIDGRLDSLKKKRKKSAIETEFLMMLEQEVKGVSKEKSEGYYSFAVHRFPDGGVKDGVRSDFINYTFNGFSRILLFECGIEQSRKEASGEPGSKGTKGREI